MKEEELMVDNYRSCLLLHDTTWFNCLEDIVTYYLKQNGLKLILFSSYNIIQLIKNDIKNTNRPDNQVICSTKCKMQNNNNIIAIFWQIIW